MSRPWTFDCCALSHQRPHGTDASIALHTLGILSCAHASTCIVAGSRSNALEDPWTEPSESMFTRSVSPEQAPDTPTYVEIEFEKVHAVVDFLVKPLETIMDAAEYVFGGWPVHSMDMAACTHC